MDGERAAGWWATAVDSVFGGRLGELNTYVEHHGRRFVPPAARSAGHCIHQPLGDRRTGKLAACALEQVQPERTEPCAAGGRVRARR